MKHSAALLARARSLLDESAEELYENAPCGYLSALPDGTIVRINRWIVDVLQRDRDELVGKVRMQELLTIGGRIYFETHVRPLLQMQGYVREIALELKGADQPVPVLLNATLASDVDGTPLGIRASLVDVTERRLYERELLIAREAAEESARIKSELISMISHDVRSPLTSIMTAQELLRRTDLSENQARLVRILGSAAQNVLTLIDDVLDLGKLEAGRVSLEHKPLDVHHLVDALLDEHRIKAEVKKLALHVDIDDAIPRKLMGDPIKLGRVIDNLLSNAIKFTDKGRVSLTIKLAEADASHVVLRFEVQDTGIGIAPDKIARVFEDFQQGDENIAGRYGGSGLGLGICQKLLALYRSELYVDSTPGQGATFWFSVRLPRLPPPGGGGNLAIR